MSESRAGWVRIARRMNSAWLRWTRSDERTTTYTLSEKDDPDYLDEIQVQGWGR